MQIAGTLILLYFKELTKHVRYQNVAIKVTNFGNELRLAFNIGRKWSMHMSEVIKSIN